MTSRPEQIMSTVASTLTGLATTGTNVFRGRVYPLEDDELPALTVYMGSDDPIGENGPTTFTLQDSDLTVKVMIHVRSSTAQVETLLNAIRSEVYAALTADRTQGLSYVQTTISHGTEEPELSGEGEKRTAVMELDWTVRYRTSATSLEV